MNNIPRDFAAVGDSRHNNFDFLRFFFALMVIFSHAYILSGYQEPIETLTQGQASGGAIAVIGFFLLSGFLITKSWVHTPDLKGFLRKRLRRILPGFLVALLFCVFVVGPLSGVDLLSYFRDRRTYRFLLQGIGLGTSGLPHVFTVRAEVGNVNGSLWTIRIEFLCYLMLAFCGISGLLRSRFFALVILIAASCGMAVINHFLHLPFLLEGIFSLAPVFLIGVLFYLFKDSIPRHSILVLLSLLSILWSCFSGSYLAFILPICGAYLLFSFGFSSVIQLQNFGRHGDFSYGLYLYAFPIQQLINQYLPWDLHPIYRFFLAVPPTLLLAWASWNWVEKRFLQGSRPIDSGPLVAHPAKHLEQQSV